MNFFDIQTDNFNKAKLYNRNEVNYEYKAGKKSLLYTIK